MAPWNGPNKIVHGVETKIISKVKETSHNRAVVRAVYCTLRDRGPCIAVRARDTDRKSDCPIIIT